MGDQNVTLASMHSISKGFYGECGRRGGYLELVNVSPDVVSEFYKLASINLCSNLNGQICMALVMNPPKVSLLPCCICSSPVQVGCGKCRYDAFSGVRITPGGLWKRSSV